MVNIEIYLDGKLIDITDEVSFRFTYQFVDISNIQAKRTSFSKPFIVPGTKRNNIVFDNLYDLQVKSNFNIQKRSDVLVKIDGIDLISGWATIEKIKIKDDQANNSSYYEITISDDVNNIFTSLKGKSMTTLDLDDFNHDFTLTNVVNSWNSFIKYKGQDVPARLGFGYDYPLVDLGGKFSKPNNTDWFLTGFRPWLFAKTIVDQIFIEEGATYEGFFDSDYFRKLLISPEPNGLKLTEDEIVNKTFNVGLQTASYSVQLTFPPNPFNGYTRDYFGQTSDTGPSLASVDRFASEFRLKYNEYQTFSTEVRHNGALYTPANPDLKKRVPFKVKVSQNGNNYFDNSNQFNSGSFSYVSNTNSIENVIITIPSLLRIHLPSPFNPGEIPGPYPKPSNGFDGFGPGYNGGTFLNDEGTGIADLGRGEIKGVYRTYCRRAATGVVEILDSRVENYLWEPDNGAYSTYTPKSFSAGYWIYEYLPPTPVPDDTIGFLLNPGDEIWVEFSYLMLLDNDNAKWCFNNCYAVIAHLSTGVDEFKNEPSDEYFLENKPIEIKRLLPDVNRLEFLASLFSMFNLYIIEDKLKKNHFIIKTRDTFFDFSDPYDWTYKLDRTEYEKKPLPLLNKKEYKLAYKEDKDYYNTTYDIKAGKTWGEYTRLIDNGTVEGEEKLNLIFSPTPMLNDSVTNRRISRIFDWDGASKKAITFNPRILFKKFLNHSQYNIDNFNILWSGGTYSATSHSTATHLDDPYSPTYDLNFYYNTAPGYYFINHPLVNRNLYNMFWKNYLDNITDPDNFMLTGFFNLNLKDIYEFDFRKTIFIDNQYYYVNRIIDYNPDRTLTKVELIKIKNYNPGDFLGIISDGRPTGGQKSLTPTIKIGGVEPVKSPDTGVINDGNNTGKVLTPSVAVGVGNLIRNSGGLIVAGRGNQISNTNDSSITGDANNIIASDNLSLSGTNASVYNSKNTTITGSSMSVSSAEGANIVGSNLLINQKVRNSTIIGRNLTLTQGDLVGDFDTGTTSNPGDFRSANFDAVLFVGKDKNLTEKFYEDGLVSSNLYFPEGPQISATTYSIILNPGTGSSFIIGSQSINIGGAVSYNFKEEVVTATSSYQSVQTRNDDYFILIKHNAAWLGATGIGDILLPDAALFPGRQLIYKVTSTFSGSGWWKINNATNTINNEFHYDLSLDNDELIILSSDGVSNWNILSRVPEVGSSTSGATGPAGATGSTGATGPAGATGSGFQTISSAADGVLVSGTLTETITLTASIPAGTYTTNDIVDLSVRLVKTTNFSNSTIKTYFGPSASSTSGAIQISQVNMGTLDKFIQISRLLAVKNETSSTQVLDKTINIYDDMTASATFDNLSIDWTTDNFLIVTIQNNSTSESARGSLYRLFKT